MKNALDTKRRTQIAFFTNYFQRLALEFDAFAPTLELTPKSRAGGSYFYSQKYSLLSRGDRNNKTDGQLLMTEKWWTGVKNAATI